MFCGPTSAKAKAAAANTPPVAVLMHDAHYRGVRMSTAQLQKLYRHQTADPFEPRTCPRAGVGEVTSPNTSEIMRDLDFLSPVRWDPPNESCGSSKGGHSGGPPGPCEPQGGVPRGYPLGRVAGFKIGKTE
eukprot:13967409-Alexandrium_andersonii.AAC.1